MREGSQSASVSKYKRLNGSVYEPSGYLSRFSEIIPGIVGRRFRLFRDFASGYGRPRDFTFMKRGKRSLLHSFIRFPECRTTTRPFSISNGRMFRLIELFELLRFDRNRSGLMSPR